MLPIVVRKEIQSATERRTPLSPGAVSELIAGGLTVRFQPSERRIFSDSEYIAAGAAPVLGSRSREILLGITPPPLEEICESQVHLMFSCSRKGQRQAIPLLKELVRSGSTLIDYELVADESGRRPLSFGRFGGIAGAIDAFWIAGKKLALKGQSSPLERLQQTRHYASLAAAAEAIGQLAPLDFPIRVLITGLGSVAQGSREVCQWLGLRELEPSQVLADPPPDGPWFSLLDISDLVSPTAGGEFDLVEYLAEGKNLYRSSFSRYLGRFDLLLQGMYWDERYPKQLPRETLLAHKEQLPWLIADIACDLTGSLECTLETGSVESPSFTYLVDEHRLVPGISWDGPTVLAVENFATELAADSSLQFSKLLTSLVPAVAAMDLSRPLSESGLPYALQRATILYKGELTPRFGYLRQFIES